MNIYRAGRLIRPVMMMTVALACLFITSGDGTSVAGIQGSGFAFRQTAFGHITAFGSIFVNGVEYETSAARVQIDGEPAPASRLRVGQVVTVKADVNADGTSGAATEVSFASDVLGPVAQVDLAGGTLVILGQRIRLLSDTLLDEHLNLGGILGLLPGIKVQVSGFPNAAGELVASRIDLVLGGPADARVKGTVQALNTAAHTFRVNTQTVDYSGTAPMGTLADGADVLVQGSIPAGQASLRASRVEVVLGVGGEADERGHIEGLITVFNNASDFKMGTQRIATDASTLFLLHGQALGPNLAVEVRGIFNAAGVLVAQQVETRTSGLVGALGVVESVSASSHSLRVQGVNFTTSAATAFDDPSAQHLRPFALSDVRVGDYVELRGGTLEPGGAIQATLVRRNDARNDFYLEGTALAMLAPGFRVLGVQVITTPQTRFPGGGLLAGLKFFLQAPNRIVRVHGALSGQVLVAEQVEIVK
jgi:hypothetical protein